MKQSINILLILTLLFLSACKNDCRVVEETYDNGNEKVIKYYPDCNDTTTYMRETYYKNRQKSSEGYVVNDVENGKFKSWTENGILTADWEVLNGKEHGLIQCWYDNGVKKREVVLNKGIEDGIFKDWDEEGQPIVSGHYENGKQDGKWTYWESNGTWKIRTFKNDTLSGYTYEYLVDSTDTTHVVGQYLKGKEQGLWKWFDQDSILYQTAIFENGEYTGEFIEYHKNGSIKTKGYLVNGKYDGKVTFYDNNGNLTKTSTYRDGKKTE